MITSQLKRLSLVICILLLASCGGGSSSSGGIDSESLNGFYQGTWTVAASAMTAEFSSTGARDVGVTFSDTGSNSKTFNIQLNVNNGQISIELANDDSTFTATGEISSNGTFSASSSEFASIFTRTVNVLNSDGAVTVGVGTSGQYTFSGSIQNDIVSGESSARFRSSVINDLDTGIVDVVVFIDLNGAISAAKGTSPAPASAPFDIFIQL